MKILIGTNNPGKLKEYKGIFQRQKSNAEIFSLGDLGINIEVEESADNLLDNAKKKAKAYGDLSGYITIADDVGLFIDALFGFPGLHTNRWFLGTETERNNALLEKMKDLPEEKRLAHFKGVVAIYDPFVKSFWIHEKKVEGLIAKEFKGSNGFGYDPIFYVNDFGKHYAELTDEEIELISHRGEGVSEFLKHLSKR